MVTVLVGTAIATDLDWFRRKEPAERVQQPPIRPIAEHGREPTSVRPAPRDKGPAYYIALAAAHLAHKCGLRITVPGDKPRAELDQQSKEQTAAGPAASNPPAKANKPDAYERATQGKAELLRLLEEAQAQPFETLTFKQLWKIGTTPYGAISFGKQKAAPVPENGHATGQENPALTPQIQRQVADLALAETINNSSARSQSTAAAEDQAKRQR